VSGFLWYYIKKKKQVCLEILRVCDPNVSGKQFTEVEASSLPLKVMA